MRAATWLSLVALATCATPEPRIGVENAWSRPTTAAGLAPRPLPSGPGVVYASVVNRGGAADRLTGASSPVSESVEIHHTTLIDDRMRMAPVEGGIEIPARETVELKPGGYHVMLFGLRRQLREGDRFEIEFEFEQSGRIRVTAEVRAP
jgi:copper(I)-binding protein